MNKEIFLPSQNLCISLPNQIIRQMITTYHLLLVNMRKFCNTSLIESELSALSMQERGYENQRYIARKALSCSFITGDVLQNEMILLVGVSVQKL